VERRRVSDRIDELIARAADAAVRKRAATVEARRCQLERSRLIFEIRQESAAVSGRPWSSVKIARKLQQHLAAAGVQVDSGHGISHDNVRRVVEGPEPAPVE
jgi:hypothetical protein